MLATTQEVAALVSKGVPLVVAGEEALLRELPTGPWIGGTIPYFMTGEGGKTTRDRLFVDRTPELAIRCTPVRFDQATISRVGIESPEHGYTVLIIPAGTALHQQYALEAPRYEEIFFKVVAGWIAGVHLDDLERAKPKVFFGPTGEVSDSTAVAMHVELPATHRAQLGLVNIFEQGTGDDLAFPTTGFEVKDCTVNGRQRNFHDYFVDAKLDSRLPLVADFLGTRINVSIQALDAKARTVRFFAPVFEGVPYRLAAPIENYAGKFLTAIPADVANPAFTCNCVLNYVYGGLEGRRTGQLLGPMTFGEIAYQLLNQTLVYVTIGPAK